MVGCGRSSGMGGGLNVRRGNKNTTLIPFDYFWHSFTFRSWDSGSKKKRNNSNDSKIYKQYNHPIKVDHYIALLSRRQSYYLYECI